MSRHKLIFGDCLYMLRGLESGSVDAVVTDPPGGIKFMGKKWDYFRNRGQFVDFLAPRLAECLRVARPGARMLCWALPRTSHWTGTAIEDAGWLIEDRVSHIFGQGFPKAKSKLKPAMEDWYLARKPGGKVPDLNVDQCRIGTGGQLKWSQPRDMGYHGGSDSDAEPTANPAGRWPANLCLSHHPACRQVGTKRVKGSNGIRGASTRIYGGGKGFTKATGDEVGYAGPDGLETVAAWECVEGCPIGQLDADSGGSSRFFYCGKASRRDRGEGNTHPTCKSQKLMRWLIRLICKPGDQLIDPFAGSGTTMLAALAEGVDSIGIEDDSEPGSFATAERRLTAVARRLT